MSNYKMNDHQIKQMYEIILNTGEQGISIVELKHKMSKITKREPNVESNLSRMDNMGLLICEDQNRIYTLESFYSLE